MALDVDLLGISNTNTLPPEQVVFPNARMIRIKCPENPHTEEKVHLVCGMWYVACGTWHVQAMLHAVCGMHVAC
jgi:hypothetical protein